VEQIFPAIYLWLTTLGRRLGASLEMIISQADSRALGKPFESRAALMKQRRRFGSPTSFATYPNIFCSG